MAKTILQSTVKGPGWGGWGGEEDKADRKKEVGRQQQGMHRPGVRQVPESSGEQEKKIIEETGCEVICGAPMTPAVKG